MSQYDFDNNFREHGYVSACVRARPSGPCGCKERGSSFWMKRSPVVNGASMRMFVVYITYISKTISILKEPTH
jgi:hypothetical protein